ncbi:outer membrane protein transport protein [Kovacikia minuta CCNUW1]|uniref:OmpP1/FadL family transporter n=1 Tax=Kovacikia minuta TaxID=2931930 RepID=UPI001CCCAFF2|nr:outer membrane protein transport protein [Kovacikia minuta]UBF25063.1 outer membrane protein transport protein [Kovacikia minuta CCNUW1]
MKNLRAYSWLPLLVTLGVISKTGSALASGSVGYNLGLLYEPTPTTRFGLAYRSRITHKLEGDADFTVPTSAAFLTRTGRFTDTDASAELKLPDSLSLGVYHELSPRVALMGDVTWTNWSRFQELRVDYANPVQPPTIQRENWEDTIRVGIGVNYAATDTLKLRAGFAFDQSPVKDEFRTARIPDGDRYWLAIGASYRPSKNLSLDNSYAHLFVGNVSINEGSATTGFLRGEFDNHVDIVGAQVTWNF